VAGISKVIIIGNIGRDPETRYTPNGTMNVQFSLAVSRRFNDQGGQQQERTNWFRVTCWGKLAEIADGLTQNGYLVKGKQVYVEGRLDAREYNDQQGQARTSLDVNATELQLLGSRGDGEAGGQMGGAPRGGGSGTAGGSPQRENESQDEQSGNFDDVPF